MSGNLILGASHALTLARAVGRWDSDWQTASRALVPIESAAGVRNHLLFVTNRPSLLELQPGANGGVAARFGPLMDQIRAYDRPDAKVVFAIGGNEHNIRFLAGQARPFDFVHPAHPRLEPGRQVIPAREIAKVLRGLLERMLVVTRLIAAELPQAQRYYLPPPPPIASEAHIRANTEGYFEFAAHGVEAASVRLKLHALYLEILAAFCAANRLRLIPPNPDGRDPQGFLREPYWEGCTHATPDYYAGIVADLGL